MSESFLAKVRALRPDVPVQPADPFDTPGPVNGNGLGYAQAALASEADEVARAQEGTRNDTLNRAAFSLGQLVAGGELSHGEVVDALNHAARMAGLGETEIAATIASGMDKGALSPRTVPEPPSSASVGTTATVRRIVLVPASSIRPRRVEWLWTERIPLGEVTLTPGRGGIGKSTFHAWTIAQITRGTLPGAHHGRPRSCIIAAAEDSWTRTVVPRLIAAGADLDRVFRVDVLTAEDSAGHLSLPADCSLLASQIEEYDVALVSLDPLLSVIHAGIDTHRNAEVRTVLEPLSRLADATGVVVLGNAHFNKSGGTDPLNLITGSAAFGEVIRAALGFARDPDAEDGSYVLSQIKNNLGRLDVPSLRYMIENAMVETVDGPADVGRFRLLGESERSVADILGDRGDEGDRTERDEAAAWLSGYLFDCGGEAPRKDVLRAGRGAGFSEATLKRARAKAGVSADRQGFAGGSVWRLGTHSAHHSEHSAQAQRAGPNGPNEPNGPADSVYSGGLEDAPLWSDGEP